MHYMGYQQNMPQQGLPNIPRHSQHQEQFSQQPEQKIAFTHREDADFQQGKQVGFSQSQIHQNGVPPAQNFPPEDNSSGQPGQTALYGGSEYSVQQASSFGQLQHSGINHQQRDPRLQSQMSEARMHGQQPNDPPAGFC